MVLTRSRANSVSAVDHRPALSGDMSQPTAASSDGVPPPPLGLVEDTPPTPSPLAQHHAPVHAVNHAASPPASAYASSYAPAAQSAPVMMTNDQLSLSLSALRQPVAHTPPPPTPPAPHQRFEVLAMNLFGPLPKGDQGQKWIFLVEDTATRWVEIFALTDATAETCAKVLIEEIFTRYGFPRRVISDNGTQFVSAVMQKAMFVFGVVQSLIPVYHPEANPAERKTRDMKQMLSILVGAEHRRWPEKLPAVRFALNTASNQTTGKTPAFLTFARELRSPLDDETDLREVVSTANFVPQITPYLSNFSQTLQEVKYWIEDQQDVRKVTADKTRRPSPTYQMGDLVLVESHVQSRAASGFTSKFAPRREGPFKISRVFGSTSFQVVDELNVPKGKYHSSQLTPYSGASSVQRLPKRGAKSRPRRMRNLEGESVTHTHIGDSPPSRPRRTRRPPSRWTD